MNLNYNLPQRERALLSAEENRSIAYCAPFDLSLEGEFCQDGWLVVLKNSLLVLQGGQRRKEVRLCDCGEVKCEPMVDCGVLRITPGGVPTVLIRFSMRHISRFSYIARGAQLLQKGETQKVQSLEPESTCEKCGSPMTGSHICPRCSGRGRTWRRFLSLCGPYALPLSLISFIMLVVSGLVLFQQFVLRWLVDEILVPQQGTTRQVLLIFTIMVCIVAAIIVLNTLQRYWCVVLGSKISLDLRTKLFLKIQSLSLSYLNTQKPGDLMNRVVGDTAEVRQFMEEAFSSMFSYLITMIGCIVLMLTLNWKLALVSLVFGPFAVFTSMMFRKKVGRIMRRQRRKSDQLNSQLQDVIQGIRVVKSFGKENQEATRFDQSAKEYCNIERENEIFWAVFQPLLTLMMHVGLYVAMYFGGVLVLSDQFTIGQMTQFSSYAMMLYGPLGWMTHLPRRIVRMQTGLGRIYDVLDETPDIVDSTNAAPHEIDGEVTFDHVAFGYKKYEPVLEDVSFTVKKGEMIGLVGASGSGKSTLINLIMRLYDVDKGLITIDGIDIRSITSESLHKQIGVVLQENFLFSGTIFENIRFSRPDATYEEVIAAAKMANAHDFICKFPDGYDTYVGESGHNLSGGERQRVAIARAILTDPKLLILDEATSSLDTESEFQIQIALERLCKGRTTFAIAHRLSTLKNADRLFVLDNHRIAESGSHDELMQSSTIYKGLVEAQLEMHALKTIDDLTERAQKL